MKTQTRLFATALILTLGACAATPGYESPTERRAQRLALFERHAGAPVDRFQFFRLDRFEVLGPYELALWTRINEAWLVEVGAPCPGLEFADAIAVTSTSNYVYQRFDHVLFEQQRCRIEQIRLVDAQALRREVREDPAL